MWATENSDTSFGRAVESGQEQQKIDIQKQNTDLRKQEIQLQQQQQQTANTSAEIGRASCRKECRSRWSPYH